MKYTLAFVLMPMLVLGQVHRDASTTIGLLAEEGPLPEKILNSRSVVLYSPGFSSRELNTIHEGLIRSSIDAIAYFETDRVFAGPDVELAFSHYFSVREVECFVIFEKASSLIRLTVTPFSRDKDLLNQGQSAWRAENPSIKDILQILYSTALSAYKRQNMLINDVPETDLVVPVISGRRFEAFASDLKVDRLAVQKFGDEELDRELEEIMKAYPYKYALVDNSIAEPDLRRQGYFYILRFIHTRAPVAKQLLGYDVSRTETAVASITFSSGVEQVKTIPSDTPVFKFYARQIEFNNVYLGTKWDADLTWQQALRNFVSGFKKAMGVN